MKPRMTLMKILADQIILEKSRGEHRRYRIVMVPRKVCEHFTIFLPIATSVVCFIFHKLMYIGFLLYCQQNGPIQFE